MSGTCHIPQVVGLSGLAGSGKGAVADYLIREHGFERAKFAGALKDMIRTQLRARRVDEDTIERMIEGDLKELPTKYLNGRTPRYAMQKLGHEYGREMIHEDLWIDTLSDHIQGMDRVVIDDVRYQNEAGVIWREGGIVVRIDRPGHHLDVGQHASEAMDFETDVHIVNNGTLEDLFRQVDYRIIRREAVPKLKEAA